MTDELLERMTKALREEGAKAPAPERSSLVRARVLAQTKRRAQLRPQNLWQWAAVVCLGFFVSTAMAHVIKVQLPRVIEAFRPARPAQPVPPAPRRVTQKPRPPSAVVPEVSATSEESPAPPEPAVPADDLEAAAATPSRTPEPPAPASAPPPAKKTPRPVPKKPAPAPEQSAAAASSPVDEPVPPSREPAPEAPKLAPSPPAELAELALFRRAQALHLSKDPRAIAAWDAYLRVAGSSALAPEARYNRALGLVRARRYTEAKRALTPFAEGKYGAYRQEEARALLERVRD